MNSTELLALFREEMGDEDSQEYLWSDAALYRYMNDAQEMFCRRTEGIEDAQSAVTQLAIVPDTEWYALSPRILKVRSATRGDTGRPVGLYSVESMAARGIAFDGRTGALRAFVSGLTRGKLRAWPMPNETVTVNLSIFRLPLVTITTVGAQEFEIDAQHHIALLDWMKHKAYSKADAEAFDKRKADEHEQRFLAYCAEARKEQERARHEAGTVAYGGI